MQLLIAAVPTHKPAVHHRSLKHVHTGPSGKTSQDNSAFVTLFWLVVLVALIVWIVRVYKRRDSATVSGKDTSAKAAPPPWRLRAITPIEVSGIVPKEGEHFYWSGQANLIGEKHWSEYQGGYSGFSYRVARGLYARTGGSRGHSVRHTTVGALDEGMLFISDRRAVFIGTTVTNDIPSSKIVNVQAFVDGLRFDISNKKPQTYTTGSEEAAVIMQRVLAGQLEDRTALYQTVTKAKADLNDLKRKREAGEITESELQDGIARIKEMLPPGSA